VENSIERSVDIQNALSKSYSYKQYRELIAALLQENKTTGADQSEAMIAYAKINEQRMKRLDKTVELLPELKNYLNELKRKLTFVVLTEGWCGDAAQNIPVFSLIEEASDKFELKIILRDENLSIMDQYLTKGGRAIPKLICLDTETKKELFNWGPRPVPCQQLVEQMVSEGVSKEERGEKIHLWYAKDKTQHLQRELLHLLKIVQ